jgi:hypothetical protein
VFEGDWHEWVSDEFNLVVWALRMSDDSHDSFSLPFGLAIGYWRFGYTWGFGDPRESRCELKA